VTDGQTAETTDKGVADLCRWAAALRWPDIPEAVRERAAMIFLDDLAAIVAARAEPEVIAFQQRLADYSGPREATIFAADPRQVDRYSAALANGGAADWCELDGGYRAVICHAGLYCMSAILAEGEAAGASVEEMLTALVAGYEVVARIGRAFTFEGLVLHPHGSLAAVGAAASVARLRNLSPDHFAAAVASGATMVCPGPYNHAIEGALIRNMWPGMAAQAGLRAADWAVIGIAGRADSVRRVFAEAFRGDMAPDELASALGGDFAVSGGYHKIHACCQYGHSAVEAVQAALAGRTLDPKKIARIEVETHWKGRTLDNVSPQTTLAAKFSMQHIVAAAVLFGHANAEAFHATTLKAPAISALREKVAIGAFLPEREWPNDRPARVRIVLDDGAMLSGECLSARGGPDRPFSEAEILAKIDAIMTPAYPASPAFVAGMAALDGDLLSRRWSHIVRDIIAR